jgi:hypothetical protein
MENFISRQENKEWQIDTAGDFSTVKRNGEGECVLSALRMLSWQT